MIVDRWTVPGFAPRTVRTVLPPGHVTGAPRPLLILFDGQNVLGDDGSYAGGWHADRAVARLAAGRRRPILVGIDHGHHERLVELSPYPVMGQRGRGHDFLRWVVETLLPRLRSQHAIDPGASAVTLGGASLGGLAATYAHLTWPRAVGNVLAMSPSFWVADGAIERSLGEHRSAGRIYLDGGRRESKGTLAPRLRRIGRLLRSHGDGSFALRVVIDPKGEHRETSWRRRLPAALRWLYPLPGER
jgi:enterochelin esterase-like enzyme